MTSITKKYTVESAKPDVVGAMQVVRAKKSREQIKAERFRPFVEVVEVALAESWSWSAIVALIREHKGPSLTKKEAEALYAQSQRQREPRTVVDTGMKDMCADTSTNAPQLVAKEESE